MNFIRSLKWKHRNLRSKHERRLSSSRAMRRRLTHKLRRSDMVTIRSSRHSFTRTNLSVFVFNSRSVVTIRFFSRVHVTHITQTKAIKSNLNLFLIKNSFFLPQSEKKEETSHQISPQIHHLHNILDYKDMPGFKDWCFFP
jgi:hypothetical protein